MANYNDESAEKIASHYNRLQDSSYGKVKREETRIYPLRNFNNWAKSCLINCFGKKNSSVIDLCSGRGGDLGKFEGSLKPSYISMVDFSLLSLLEAAERYNQTLRTYYETTSGRDRRQRGRNVDLPPPLDLVWGDCFMHDLASNCSMVRDCGVRFSYAQIQFGLHYSWFSEDRARKLLENVGAVLAPNNCFVATFPDKRIILSRAAKIVEKQGTCKAIGNSFYKVEFPTTLDQRKLDLLRKPGFGQIYKFFLEGAVEEEECLVDIDLLTSMAAEYGLNTKMIVPFADFEHVFNNPPSIYSTPECMNAFIRYNRPPRSGQNKPDGSAVSEWNGISLVNMDPELSDVVKIYVAIVFQRAPIAGYVGTSLGNIVPSCQPLCLGSIMSLYGEGAVDGELKKIYDQL